MWDAFDERSGGVNHRWAVSTELAVGSTSTGVDSTRFGAESTKFGVVSITFGGGFD